MQPATVYQLGAAMALPGRAIVRNALKRLEAKRIVERERTELIWHGTHPSLLAY